MIPLYPRYLVIKYLISCSNPHVALNRMNQQNYYVLFARIRGPPVHTMDFVSKSDWIFQQRNFVAVVYKLTYCFCMKAFSEAFVNMRLYYHVFARFGNHCDINDNLIQYLWNFSLIYVTSQPFHFIYGTESRKLFSLLLLMVSKNFSVIWSPTPIYSLNTHRFDKACFWEFLLLLLFFQP